ncbi:MAG: DUF975 family protein [Clostridia bacterium]|nr:DUF975 family protein [Clostridia bacterium]
MNRVELKERAKAQISGKIGKYFLTYLAYVCLATALSLTVGLIPFAGSIVASAAAYPMMFGIIMICIAVADGKDFKVADMFNGYYDWWGAIKTYFFVGLFTTLWMLLLIIPGIVKAYSYRLALYIKAENKEMGALEAIRKSKEIMNGHKLEWFVLDLSFIGWILLICVTFGIAAIWVTPYMDITYANAYRKMCPKALEAEVAEEITEE